jgi:hypothetical protein
VGETYSSRRSVVLERAGQRVEALATTGGRSETFRFRFSGSRTFRGTLPGPIAPWWRIVVLVFRHAIVLGDPYPWRGCSAAHGPGDMREAGGGRRATVNERIDRIEARARKATGFGRTRDA